MAEVQPIIVKKIKKGGHGGHHGGSWKVAYADFVTAMMAFFLLLWLLSASSEATLSGIADYFENPSAIEAAGGTSTSMIELGNNIDTSKGDGDENRESNSFEYYSEDFEQREMEKLQDLKQELEYIIENEPELSKFKEQLLLNITTEGLVIQIIDKENRPMFDLGSAVLKPYANRILKEMAPILNELPNKLSISGHTDAKRFFRRNGYSNWELSSDRANAARRQLVASKMPSEKIVQVVGLASKFLLYKDKPFDPGNRRMSILVLKKRSEDNMYRDMGLKPDSLPEEIREKLLDVGQAPKKVASEKDVQNVIRSGTIRRSGEIIRFRGE